jgi:hypothetical protein
MPLEQVSYSSLKQWSLCPRLGYLGQHLGLQKVDQDRTGALPFGSRVHLALQLWGESGWMIPPAKIWKRLMDREFILAEELGWPHELDKESAMGQVMLEGFAEWLEEEGIYSKWTVVGIETKLSTTLTIELEDGQQVDVLLRGKLDLLEQRNSDGALFVDDYKTTSSLTEDSIQAKLSESQLPLYVILARRQAPDQWVSGGVFTQLRKVLRGPRSKAPFYDRLEIPYSDAKLAAAERNIVAEASAIASIVEKLERGANHLDVAPYHPSWACKTCPFRLPCTEMQEGNLDGADRMLENLYAEGNPLQRYEDDQSNTLEALGFRRPIL